MELRFYYDVVCPYAAIAAADVERLAQAVGARLVWKPVLLGGILRAVGSEDRPSSSWSGARARMGLLDLDRQAELRGVPLTRHPLHPVRTVEAMRLLTVADAEKRGPLSRELFEAYHVLGLDLSDRTVLAEIARRYDVSIEGIDDPEVKQALRDTTAQALELGAFGVPVFHAVTADDPQGRIWWGADRMHLVEAAMRGFSARTLAPADLQRDGAAQRPARPTGNAVVEVFHDFSSPFSYLGVTQVQRVAAEHGADVIWRPMLLGALFKAIGTPDVPLAVMNQAKAAYYLRDLHDWAKWWGVPFTFPDCFPVRTVTALRVALIDPRATHTIYKALWVEGRDIGDDDVLRQVLAEAGFDPGMIAQTANPEVKGRLRANTEDAVELGACGAPSFLVRGEDDGARLLPDRLIWGQDRFDLVGACLDGWRPSV